MTYQGTPPRRSGRQGLAAGILILTVAATVVANGQSLGELAKQEEARRKAIKTSGKVYTNESIRGQAVPSRPAPATAPASAASPPPASPAAEPPSTKPQNSAASKTSAPPVETAEVKDEAYWKKRIQSARDQLGRAQMFADALQTRINVLSADFVARDDPAQRAVIATDRQKALAELDRVKQEIGQFTKAIAEIQTDARRANVPPGWLR